MPALLAGLADAADDHVLYRCRIDAAAIDDRIEHLAAEIGRVPAG
jgi:hypothetical protein